MDLLSKSDPCVYLFQQGVLFGKTEVIKDNLNPSFVHPFLLDYFFEQHQLLRLVVVDVDDPNASWDKQDFLGELTISLGQLVSAPGQSLTRALEKCPKNAASKMILTVEEVVDCRHVLKCTFGAHLPKRGLLRKSPNAVLQLSRLKEDGGRVVVYRTAPKTSSDPIWDPFKIRIQTLCNGDRDRALLWEVVHLKSNGVVKPIASLSASCEDILCKKEMDLKTEDRSVIGSLRILQCVEEAQPSFLDYIRGGCQVNLSVAVDFTLSNGDPQLPSSLHYRGVPGRERVLNEYEQAIQAVGRILIEYDSDKLVSVFGFGGKLPTGDVSHCWPLNGNENDPSCHGVDGVLQAYRLALDHAQLAAPTNFAPCIKRLVAEVTEEVQASQLTGKQSYHVLLMLTDGVITDLDSTIRAIIMAARLPISIVIVGVGKESFESMHVLDADTEPLKMDGETAERDIVQFVPLRKFIGPACEAQLAAEVLAELPQQLLDYFTSRKMTPRRS